MNELALKTHLIKKHFGGVYAVNGVSLNLAPGVITAIVGPNGSGKTTLVNLLSGMLGFDQGYVEIEGAALKKIKPHRLPAYGLTRTFQEVRLFEQMSVLDNILVVVTERNFFTALFQKHTQADLKKAREALTKVGLWEKRGQLAKNLSYGQRKLLELARVLAMDAKIILLDEPFAGLFREMTKSVVEIMRELKTVGKTILLIEHNMDIIRQLSDYLYVLDDGQVLAEGEPKKVLAERKVIEAYLGE